MIEDEEINGLDFVAQTTFYVYSSRADRLAGKGATLTTSDKAKFEQNKELARENEKAGKPNKFIVL